MEKPIFYLGVDAGGTKGRAMLTDKNQKILAQREGKALSYNSVGETGVKQNLTNLLNPLLRKVRTGNAYAVLGFAGCNSQQEKILYTKIVRTVLPRSIVFKVVNDAATALEAKCPGEKDRILVISGTGSSVFGESGNKQAKSIGWDYLLADEGSGYQFGLQLAKAVIQAYDGRGNQTVLTKLFLKELKVKTVNDLIAKIYDDTTRRQKNPKYYFASFAHLLDQAINKEDPVAKEIRDKGAADLAKGVSAVGTKLNLKEKRFVLGYIGSQWAKMPGLQAEFEKHVRREFSHVQFSHREDPATLGAIRLAKKLK